MTDAPSYLLFCRPRDKAAIRDFFSAFGDMYSLLVHPPETRYGSFGMRMAVIPQLTNGEYWEMVGHDPLSGGIRKLRVYSDGATIFRAPGDGSFLCWPRDTGARVINPVVVADSVISFARFVRKVLELMTVKPSEMDLGVEIRNAGKEPPLLMYSGPLRRNIAFHRLGPADLHSASEMHPRRTVTVTVEELMCEAPDDPFFGPDEAAYRLVAQLYEVFGYSSSEVPYVERSAARPRLSVPAFS